MVAALAAGTLTMSVALAVYGSIAAGLPEPADALEAIRFEQQSAIYDRTGQGPARDAGQQIAGISWTFDEIPPELVDATTSIEDKTFWENRDFDPFGIVSAAIDSFDGPAAWRLDGDDAAGPDAPPARPSRRPAAHQDRKAMEIVQAVRLTNAYPGYRGQAPDHDRLPQQQLLRELDVRSGGSGAGLLERRPRCALARAGGDPRRHPASPRRDTT